MIYNGEFARSESNDFDETKVFEVRSENFLLLFWNSSNEKRFDKIHVLDELFESKVLLESQASGSIHEPYQMVDVMWEITEL